MTGCVCVWFSRTVRRSCSLSISVWAGKSLWLNPHRWVQYEARGADGVRPGGALRSREACWEARSAGRSQVRYIQVNNNPRAVCGFHNKNPQTARGRCNRWNVRTLWRLLSRSGNMLKTATCDGRCWILIVICAVSLHHAELHLKSAKLKIFIQQNKKNQMTNVNSVFFHYVLRFGSFISGGAFFLPLPVYQVSLKRPHTVRFFSARFRVYWPKPMPN